MPSDRIVEVEPPASCSFMIATAVNVFECEATRKRCCGVSGVPSARAATPNARSVTSLPWCAIASTQPGCSVDSI